MNTFGQLFRVSVFGESHGACAGITVDGVPAGIPFTTEDMIADLQRRQGGNMQGTTPRKESDIPKIISGVFNDKTTGAPLTIIFENNNIDSSVYEKQRAIPRPGHADFVAEQKFGGHQDYRGSGHFSARLTVGIVAAGVLAKKIIAPVTVSVHVTEVDGENDIETGIKKAVAENDSVGALVECNVTNVPVGLGEPFFDSIESVLSHAMFSIPAVKGVEFGAGFAAARMRGSKHNDAIISSDGKTKTNHAGGITGGITNGNDIVFRLAFKPASSTPKEQTSMNMQTQQLESFSLDGRHDLCVALRAPAIVEALTAIVLTDAMLLAQFSKRVATDF
ncbi:MAG: chorismate synthase [Bacteroidetes bacterium]|nr:chorismate synthase [Bacteroidota bacterium]